MPIDYRPPEPIALRPVAAPVDTYEGAGPLPRSGSVLADLAQGLSQADSGLKAFLEARQARQAQEDAVKGLAAFYENNQQGFEDAVREGKIPSHASPTFVAAYKKAQGNVAGFDLQARFSAAYDAWDGKTSEDPQAFTKFVQEFTKENLGGSQDPHVLRGLLPHVNAMTANGLQKWISDRHEQTYKGALITRSAETHQSIEGAKELGLQDGRGTDYPALFAKILADREAAIKSGLKPLDYDKALSDTIAAKALEDRDPKLLDFFNQKVPGTDIAFGATPHGQRQKQEAIDKLETLARRTIADARAEQKERDRKAGDAIAANAIEHLAKDPAKPIPEQLLTLGSKYDPQFRVKVLEWQKKFIAATGEQSDPRAILALSQEIINGGGLAAIQGALARDVIKSSEELTKAWNLHKSVSEGGSGLKDMLGSAATRRVRSAIAARTANDPRMAGVTGDVVGMTEDGLDATNDFERMLVDFAVKNPNATTAERMEYTARAGKIILDSLSATEIFSGARYTRPPEAAAIVGGRAASSPGPSSPAQPRASSGAPQGQPVATAVIPPPRPASPEAQEWFAGPAFTDQQREQLRQKAQQGGHDFGQYIQGLHDYWKANRQERGGGGDGPPQAPSGAGGDGAETAVDEPTRRLAEANVLDAIKRFKGAGARIKATTGAPFTVAVLQDDPAAANILDFISGPEANGNYNAVIGNTRATRDLGQMSLAEVYRLQQDLVRRGMPSGAIGRYQFINRTLRSLARDLNIPESAKFTPELQDRMAVELLNRRGYREWRAGRLSDEEFARNLSKEWASLPNPTTGRSFYDGDGINKAGTTLAKVYAMLRRALGDTQGSVPRGPAEGEGWEAEAKPPYSPKGPIAAIQEVLVNTGAYPRSMVDGIFGPVSRRALNALLDREGQPPI